MVLFTQLRGSWTVPSVYYFVCVQTNSLIFCQAFFIFLFVFFLGGGVYNELLHRSVHKRAMATATRWGVPITSPGAWHTDGLQLGLLWQARLFVSTELRKLRVSGHIKRKTKNAVGDVRRDCVCMAELIFHASTQFLGVTRLGCENPWALDLGDIYHRCVLPNTNEEGKVWVWRMWAACVLD